MNMDKCKDFIIVPSTFSIQNVPLSRNTFRPIRATRTTSFHPSTRSLRCWRQKGLSLLNDNNILLFGERHDHDDDDTMDEWMDSWRIVVDSADCPEFQQSSGK